ncbi:hypothetical protein ACX8XN_08310 [Calditrichota bacterium GD2]
MMVEKIEIFVFENIDFDLDKLKTLLNKINSLQSNFYFYLNKDKKLPLQNKSIQDWDYLTKTLNEYILNNKYKIALTSNPIENNWFSFSNHKEFTSVITTHDWEYLSDLPVYSFIIFEIIENYQELRLGSMNAHNETIGCINDMCAYKLDINLKLKTGWVCPDCMNIWHDYFDKTEIESLLKILDFIRLIALNRERLWHVSYDYPYPVAIRFKIMQSELNSYLKFQKLIHLYDSIIRYISFVFISCIKNKSTISNKFRKLVNQINDDSPSLGTWEKLIEEAVLLQSSSYVLLSDSDINNIKQICSIIKNSDLRKDRNDYIGHNYTGQNLDEYLNLYLEKIPFIQQLLYYSTESIFKYKLSKIVKIERVRGNRNAFIDILVGDSNIFQRVNLFLHEEPYDERHIILLDENNGLFVDMFPFVIGDICNECGHERILYLDGKDDSGHNRFIDILMGHRTIISNY